MSSKLLLEILIIEYEALILQNIESAFNKKFFKIREFNDSVNDLKDTKLIIYDAIIIGSSLSVNAALEFALSIRTQSELDHIPIIFIIDEKNSMYNYQVAKNNIWFVHDKFMLSSLESTTKSALKAHKFPFQSKFLKYKDLCLNTQTQELHKNGRVVPLSTIEYRIMELLLRYPTHIFSRQDIIDQAWKLTHDEPVSTRAVDTHINRLRNLLKIHLNVYDLIKTIRAKGYCISLSSREDEYNPYDGC